MHIIPIRILRILPNPDRNLGSTSVRIKQSCLYLKLKKNVFFSEGNITVNMSVPSSYDYISQLHPELLPGGTWRPRNCTARHRVAIIVPFRDREMHLKVWLQHMHPVLQKQQIDYTVFVVEQVSIQLRHVIPALNVWAARA